MPHSPDLFCFTVFLCVFYSLFIFVDDNKHAFVQREVEMEGLRQRGKGEPIIYQILNEMERRGVLVKEKKDKYREAGEEKEEKGKMDNK